MFKLTLRGDCSIDSSGDRRVVLRFSLETVLLNSGIVNFLDGCALSIPRHRSGDAPVDLMLVALRGHDTQLFAAGLAIESVLAKAGRAIPGSFST